MSNHSSQTPPDDADYRESHLQRGDTYDGFISGTPWDAYMAELEKVHLERIVPELFPNRIPRYLDFACGTARVTSTVARFADKAVGVDISESMLTQARTKCPDVEFLHADLTVGGPELGQFDLLTSFRFFGNAQQALRDRVMATFARLVKKDGYLIINNHRNPHSLAILLHRATGGTTEMDLTYFRLRRLLSTHGFKIVQTHPIGTYMYRSRMLARAEKIDARTLNREKRFGHRLLSPIAPDSIIVARRIG